jgi:hypothetical protein
MRSRVGIGVVGVVLAGAVWVDFAAVRAVHQWGGVPGALMVLGQVLGLLAVPAFLWLAIRHDHAPRRHKHI